MNKSVRVLIQVKDGNDVLGADEVVIPLPEGAVLDLEKELIKAASQALLACEFVKIGSKK